MALLQALKFITIYTWKKYRVDMFYSACSWCQWVQNLVFICQLGEILNIDTHKKQSGKWNPCSSALLQRICFSLPIPILCMWTGLSIIDCHGNYYDLFVAIIANYYSISHSPLVLTPTTCNCSPSWLSKKSIIPLAWRCITFHICTHSLSRVFFNINMISSIASQR